MTRSKTTTPAVVDKTESDPTVDREIAERLLLAEVRRIRRGGLPLVDRGSIVVLIDG